MKGPLPQNSFIEILHLSEDVLCRFQLIGMVRRVVNVLCAPDVLLET